MRGIRAWSAVARLRRAVVENSRSGDAGEVVVSARPNWRERDRSGCAGAGRRVSSSARDAGGGGRWASGRRRSRSVRPSRRGCAAGVTVRLVRRPAGAA